MVSRAVDISHLKCTPALFSAWSSQGCSRKGQVSEQACLQPACGGRQLCLGSSTHSPPSPTHSHLLWGLFTFHSPCRGSKNFLKSTPFQALSKCLASWRLQLPGAHLRDRVIFPPVPTLDARGERKKGGIGTCRPGTRLPGTLWSFLHSHHQGAQDLKHT